MDPAVNSPRNVPEPETNRMASLQVGFYLLNCSNFLTLHDQVGQFGIIALTPADSSSLLRTVCWLMNDVFSFTVWREHCHTHWSSWDEWQLYLSYRRLVEGEATERQGRASVLGAMEEATHHSAILPPGNAHQAKGVDPQVRSETGFSGRPPSTTILFIYLFLLSCDPKNVVTFVVVEIFLF